VFKQSQQVPYPGESFNIVWFRQCSTAIKSTKLSRSTEAQKEQLLLRCIYTMHRTTLAAFYHHHFIILNIYFFLCFFKIFIIYFFFSLFFFINLSISYLHFECYSLSLFPGQHPPNPSTASMRLLPYPPTKSCLPTLGLVAECIWAGFPGGADSGWPFLQSLLQTLSLYFLL